MCLCSLSCVYGGTFDFPKQIQIDENKDKQAKLKIKKKKYNPLFPINP